MGVSIVMSDYSMFSPGLGGFLAARDRHAQQQAQQMSQAVGLAGLLHQDQQMQMAREKVIEQKRRDAQIRSYLGDSANQAVTPEQAASLPGGPTNENAAVIGAPIAPRSLFGMPVDQLRTLYAFGGQEAVTKAIEQNAKLPDKARLIGMLPKEEQGPALRHAAGVAPQAMNFDAGGTTGVQLYDPITRSVSPVSERQKTNAPASRPIWLNADGTINQQIYLGEKNLRRAGATNVNVDAKERARTFEWEDKLRNDFKADPRVKGADEMNMAFQMIDTAFKNPSPANDLAMATKYMKILDPTSVVRESELALALAATGLLDKVKSYAENVVSGKKLNPTQRQDFYDSAKAINDAFQAQVNRVRDEYHGMAKQYGLNPNNVTPSRNSDGRLKFDAAGNEIK